MSDIACVYGNFRVTPITKICLAVYIPLNYV